MNGFGYDPMWMYPSSPYYSYGMNNNNQQPQDPNQQEQASFVEHLRTWISGLSAMTGISYGFASLLRVIMKIFKFFNIFKRKGASNPILTKIWKISGSNNGKNYIQIL